ncbi:competence protein ComA [Mannheimia pernigra]|uniref:competence protein ComA n=1 Tax=Mannheimia pernigra TaxID=111844 RepID=UPI00159F5806|nr:competence protein ComA [Mannheimia pernigra]QLB44177.1 competence protein ComA [Mannheimia pernigra]
MKLLKSSSKKPLQPTIIGLSENEQYYCLVKNEENTFNVFWQKKREGLESAIQTIMQKDMAKSGKKFSLVRAIPYQYIWRKTVFMSKNLDEIQLHRQIILILKNEQPLAIELLNFDYQRFPSSNNNLDRIIIYAINKKYAESLNQFSSILDCELHCYMRGLFYLMSEYDTKKSFSFSFKEKICQFTETELYFYEIAPEDCIHLSNISITDIDIQSDDDKQLYCLALGASLWNGKVLI